MTIHTESEGTRLTLRLGGRMDAVSAPEAEDLLRSRLDGVTELILDLNDLVYISSAGLRVLLSSFKRMTRRGSMTIRNVCPTVMEVLELTGFSDIMNIQ